MTSIIQPTRRGLIGMFAVVIAAPAVVRITSLMPVSAVKIKIVRIISHNHFTVLNMSDKNVYIPADLPFPTKRILGPMMEKWQRNVEMDSFSHKTTGGLGASLIK